MKALIITAVLILTGCSTTAVQPPQPDPEGSTHQIVHSEQGVVLTDSNGEYLTCLLTGEGNGFTGIPGWVGLTCSLGTDTAGWRFCAGKHGVPFVACAPPGPVNTEMFRRDQGQPA